MGSVNCLRRRRRQASQADNNLAKIAIHEKPAQRQLVASLPVAMSTAARQGAPRNQGMHTSFYLREDTLTCAFGMMIAVCTY